MRRTSFVGVLTSFGFGAVLAFAVRVPWRDLDVRTAGVIVMLGALADLVIRVLIADSPLLSSQSADIAAVVEPLGEPLLDARGNPVIVANPAATPHSPLTNASTDSMRGLSRSMIPDATGSESRSPDAGHLTGGWALHEHAAFGTDEPLDTPEAPIAVTTMMGRPIHPRGRRLGGGRIRR